MTNDHKYNLQFFDFSLPKEISCENWIFDSDFSNNFLFIDFNKHIFNEID
jgi:hypothetical protein